MSIFKQKEKLNLERLRSLAARLLYEIEDNGYGVTTYIYKDDMLEEIIKCFYGEEKFKEIRYYIKEL